ncbi:putative NRPS-like enzyme [Halenospora varia]|nr:putative NRPS-like enzyme [Halenospora varia]
MPVLQNIVKEIEAGIAATVIEEEVDEIYSINDLLLERTRTIPDDPLVGYPSSIHSPGDYVYYSAKDLSRFADGTAQALCGQGLPFADTSSRHESKIVALLGPSNLDYVISIFALSRMGYGVLFLSTRLATEAYVSLLEKTKCSDVMFTSSTAKSLAAIKEIRNVNSYTIPEKSTYDSPCSIPPSPVSRSDPSTSNKIAFIIHSSGSTGLPKPIFQTNKACLSNYASGSGYRAFLTLPLYHNHGISTFFRAITKCKPISLYNASLPLTGPNLVKAMESVQPESFHGVPYALKLLSESDAGIAALQKCELVLFGGSSCPDDLGNKLVDAGVYVVSHYGATEMGQLMTSYREKDDKAWNYVRPLPAVAPFLSMSPQGDGSYECICLDGLPAKVASNSDDPPNSFRTSDTFLPHPTISNAWKYLGRIDDRVTLLNGEKVLPVPIENHVRQNEYVKECLVFGIDKAFPGMLVIPSEKAVGLKKEEILALIWPSIEVANSRAEGFSQIQKEMVKILDHGIAYPATDKGTLIRLASYREFADTINAVYDRFDNGSTNEAGNSSQLSLDLEELKAFVSSLFATELAMDDLKADTDFFGAGVDSLQAIKVRACLKRTLDLGGSDLDNNVVFEFPSISKLSAHLYALRTGEIAEEDDEIEAMADLIQKYSHFRTQIQPRQEIILLTGTTGSLGAHILAQLLPLENVKKIYCLVRANSPGAAMDRVLSTMAAKQLLPFKNINKIVALPASLGDKHLGLNAATMAEVKGSLTKVIHSAWAVNFNLHIRSFEQQHIAGVSNLLNLCLSVHGTTPAQFFFCSSISAAAGTPLPASIAEGPVPELAHAQDMGYARSKLVAERIIQTAAEQTGMVAKVLRVGQIVGDSSAGIWNTTEAIPLMIQCAVTVGALPALDETPAWLPVDKVAQTVLDLARINNDHDLQPSAISDLKDSKIVYHIQNPRTFHWTEDLLPSLKEAGLKFDIIGQREWVQRLRDSDPDPEKNPTRKLLEFFAGKYDNDKMGRKGLVFVTEKTEMASETLKGGFDVIGSGLVGKMVKQWRESW